MTRPVKVYVAVDIGCIECDEQSSVLGIYLTAEDADAAAAACAGAEPSMRRAYSFFTRRHHGQHQAAVFEVEAPAELMLRRDAA